MKTRFVIGICILILTLFTLSALKAQEIQYSKPENIATQIVTSTPAGYTYKIFQAPNKMYGYDIFYNGKILFHQGASPAQPNEFVNAISQKEQADKAALLSIKKITKNQPATLSQQELRKIISK